MVLTDWSLQGTARSSDRSVMTTLSVSTKWVRTYSDSHIVHPDLFVHAVIS
jgi:hypothetical protein